MDDLLEQLLAAAAAHGNDSAPDHEVGDLIAILHSAWERLSPTDRQAVFTEHAQLIEDWTTARRSKES